MDTRRHRHTAPELVALLERIWRDERSYRKMAERAGLGPDTLAKIAGGRGGMSAETAHKLADAYGEGYGFTEDQLLLWAGYRTPAKDDPWAPLRALENRGVLGPVRIGLERAETRLTPRKLATIANILAQQIEMLTRMSEEGSLPETDYRAGADEAGDE